jgi:hypothetical protein
VQLVARKALDPLAQTPGRHDLQVALQQALRIAFEGHDAVGLSDVCPLGASQVHGDVLGLHRPPDHALRWDPAVERNAARTCDPERRVETFLRGFHQRPRVSPYLGGGDLLGGFDLHSGDRRAVFRESEQNLRLHVQGHVGR